jgi:hypothetical protein
MMARKFFELFHNLSIKILGVHKWKKKLELLYSWDGRFCSNL